MAHDLKLSLVHFANIVHPINWIDVNGPVNALIGATGNYMMTRISVCLKVATITMLVLHINFEVLA